MPILNIRSDSEDPHARRLSNFSADSIILDGEKIASVEGFIQGTKFSLENPLRQEAFQSIGIKAKRFGREAERKLVWWRDQEITYGSPEHHQLIERAIRAKFQQNKEAMQALLATDGMELIHDTGSPEPPNTSLPAKIFCDILNRIRKENI